MMNTNETGRSMVEMLGVLAIIGVLSVGGIAGYNTAMKRYKVNEIVNTATMFSMMAQSANGGAGQAFSNLADVGLSQPVSGVDMNVSDKGVVTVHGATDLCSLITQTAGKKVGNADLGCTS